MMRAPTPPIAKNEVGKPGMKAIERRTMARVTRRLVPFLMLCYFIAYLDRVNVGFGGASMSRDLGLSSAAFGGAGGIFVIAYFFFEVPSNLALDRFGARRWITRIMLSWGLVSAAQALVTGELRSCCRVQTKLAPSQQLSSRPRRRCRFDPGQGRGATAPAG
jgi:MFS family permease